MTDKQRPLIPVNPKGLEDIARALLADSTTPSAEVTVAPGELPEIVRRSPRDYIWVPERNIVIATRQDYNGLNWEDAIKTVAAKKLRLTPIASFMQHYLNLRDATSRGKQLVYADGSPVSRVQAEEHWHYVSSRDRRPFGDKPFWTWLDAKFVKAQNGLDMQTNHDFVSNRVQSSITGILGNYLTNDGWADLSTLSAAGLPRNNSSTNSYSQGNNIYFWYPRDGRVAGFGAGSGRAYLYCDGVPSGVIPHLGVLACAAGVVPKK